MDDHHKVLVLRDGPTHIVQSPLESFMSAVDLYHLLEDESFIIFMNILRGRLFMFVLTGDWREGKQGAVVNCARSEGEISIIMYIDCIFRG